MSAAMKHASASTGLLGLPAAAGGWALAAVVAGVRLVRSPRPIHSAGLLLTGTIEPIRSASAAASSGIAWIDECAPGELTARLSRGAGLPVPVPDIWGLAVRTDEGGDVLLSSTRLGVPWRFVPVPMLSPFGARFSTVMPYRSSRGPVLVGARTVSGAPASATTTGQARELGRRPWVLQLLWATPTGRWRPFAVVRMQSSDGSAVDRADVRFDPVLHPPRGARTYEWTRALREPAYRIARGRGGRSGGARVA
jgi:hypothetical protein